MTVEMDTQPQRVSQYSRDLLQLSILYLNVVDIASRCTHQLSKIASNDTNASIIRWLPLTDQCSIFTLYQTGSQWCYLNDLKETHHSFDSVENAAKLNVHTYLTEVNVSAIKRLLFVQESRNFRFFDFFAG